MNVTRDVAELEERARRAELEVERVSNWLAELAAVAGPAAIALAERVLLSDVWPRDAAEGGVPWIR